MRSRSTAWPASGSGRLSRRYWTSLFASICAANSRRHLLGADPVAPGLSGEHLQLLFFPRAVLYRLARLGLALGYLIG